MAKDRYEISIWEDQYDENLGYFDEVKLATIGSDSMTTECRAIEPKLVQNINGTNTFTFKMYLSYRDENGEKYDNPFLDLLVNERKIKVLWKDEWYDFVIKNCQESSDNKSITYTCSDLYINELSKNGFDIVLDDELYNNMGTAIELGKEVVEGTDWTIKEDECDLLQEESEEAIVEIEVKWINQTRTLNAINQKTKEQIEITTPDTILIFYNQLKAILDECKEQPNTLLIKDVQFAYAKSYSTESQSQLVNNADCCVASVQVRYLESYEGLQFFQNNGKFSIKESSLIPSVSYRARRLVARDISIADPLTGKMCYIYKAVKDGQQETSSTYNSDFSETETFSTSTSGSNTIPTGWNIIKELYADGMQSVSDGVFTTKYSCGNQGGHTIVGQLLNLSQTIRTFATEDSPATLSIEKVQIKRINGDIGLTAVLHIEVNDKEVQVPSEYVLNDDNYHGYNTGEFTTIQFSNLPNESTLKIYFELEDLNENEDNIEVECVIQNPQLTSSIYDYKVNDEIYEYITTDWQTPLIVHNLISNSSNFKNGRTWRAGNGDSTEGSVLAVPTGRFSSAAPSAVIKTRLCLTPGNLDGVIKRVFTNLGLGYSTNYLPEEGMTFGQKYRLRAKLYGSAGGDELISLSNAFSSIRILDKNKEVLQQLNISSSQTADGWYQKDFDISFTRTPEELQNSSIEFTLNGSSSLYIEDIQFYRLINDEAGNPYEPYTVNANQAGVSRTYYNYYNHTQAEARGITDVNDLEILWKGTEQWTGHKEEEEEEEGDALVKQTTTDNFRKIRSISIKESNRFNILQTIAETFECWVRFITEHDLNGKIVHGQDGKPHKYIVFKKDVGEETGVGFVYGIDLKSVQRTIESNQIVTKTIVPANTNEFALHGFCDIARSKDNFSRAGYILNFDYYINHGLLDGDQLNTDLYGYGSGSPENNGLYIQLNLANVALDPIEEKLRDKKASLTEYLSTQSVANNYVNELQEEINRIEESIANLAGKKSFNEALQYIQQHQSSDQLKEKMITRDSLKCTLAQWKSIKGNVDGIIAELQGDIAELELAANGYYNIIRNAEERFNNKYWRYIQEGTWKDDKYIEDDLYYLDGLEVAYTSSRPQVSYNVSVIRLSSLDEFKEKVFNCGDISFIQDTEFFGYTMVGDVKTPYKEKVLVSEVISYFDEPEKDVITVQNYRTQFEDLFQRITSTTQSLQFASGSYNRAAGIVETEGIIKGEILKDSIASDDEFVIASQNNVLRFGKNGLRLLDAASLGSILEVTARGISISEDGGNTWNNVINGEGISADLLKAGTIYANNISIVDGENPSFRWDKYGINAFALATIINGETEQTILDRTKFVRFDQFGLYGISGIDTDVWRPTSESDIWNNANAKFGMTWKGFFMKEASNRGSIEISNENQILVKGLNDREIIKIGALTQSYTGFKVGINNTFYALTSKGVLNDSTKTYTFRVTNLREDTIQLNLSFETNITTPSGERWAGIGTGLVTIVSGEEKDLNIPITVSNGNVTFTYEGNTYTKPYGDFFFRINCGKYPGNQKIQDNTNQYCLFIQNISQSDSLYTKMSSLYPYRDSTSSNAWAEAISITSPEDVPNYGIEVRDTNGFQTFYIGQDGNLHISGTIHAVDGDFTGVIHARSGEFTGTINAGSGTIGGWNISQVRISSTSSGGSINLNSALSTSNYWLNASKGDNYCRIKKDGTIEANGGVFTGTITATDGEFTGTIKAGTVIQTGTSDNSTMLGGWQLLGDFFGKEVSNKIIGFDIGQVGTTNQVFGIGGNGADTTLTGGWGGCQFRVNGQGTILIGADTDSNQLELKAGNQNQNSTSLIRFISNTLTILQIDAVKIYASQASAGAQSATWQDVVNVVNRLKNFIPPSQNN